MKILFASGNQGKIKEAQVFLAASGLELLSPNSLFETRGDPPAVVEDALDYEGNARKKALAYLAWAELPVIADDSGLEVTALHGKPGLHTARFAGEHASNAEHRAKLLETLQQVDDREARFVCVLVLRFPDGREITARGELPGQIARSESGSGGFGYDPVFIPDGYEKTLAEIKEKEEVFTHRTRALRILLEKIVLMFP